MGPRESLNWLWRTEVACWSWMERDILRVGFMAVKLVNNLNDIILMNIMWVNMCMYEFIRVLYIFNVG